MPRERRRPGTAPRPRPRPASRRSPFGVTASARASSMRWRRFCRSSPAGIDADRPAAGAAADAAENALTPLAAVPMPLPPRTASELERIRAQTRAGRLEWQDSASPEAHIPVENYTSDSIRDAEVARLFRPLPLIAGHASELAAGQVLAHDDYGVPLLLTRDADGRFRAFLNVCRHRGMRLVAADRQGRAARQRRLPVPRLDLQARRRACAIASTPRRSTIAAPPTRTSSPCPARSGTACSGWCRRRRRRSTSPPGSTASTPSCRSSASKGCATSARFAPSTRPTGS